MTKHKTYDWYIGRILFFNFLLSVFMAVLITNNDFLKTHYNDYYYHLNELFNTSLITSVFYILITYRYKLCSYNKISSWTQLATAIFNIVAISIFEEKDFISYSSMYVNFLLYPMAILAINYLIIEERKRKF